MLINVIQHLIYSEVTNAQINELIIHEHRTILLHTN